MYAVNMLAFEFALKVQKQYTMQFETNRITCDIFIATLEARSILVMQ